MFGYRSFVGVLDNLEAPLSRQVSQPVHPRSHDRREINPRNHGCIMISPKFSRNRARSDLRIVESITTPRGLIFKGLKPPNRWRYE